MTTAVIVLRQGSGQELKGLLFFTEDRTAVQKFVQRGLVGFNIHTVDKASVEELQKQLNEIVAEQTAKAGAI